MSGPEKVAMRQETAILAIIDTPLSPTAVDGSIAPDAGTKGQDQ